MTPRSTSSEMEVPMRGPVLQASEGIVQRYNYRPVTFFLVAFVLTFIPSGFAAHYSFVPGEEITTQAFVLLGLLGPFTTAMLLIFLSGNRTLKADFWDKLINLRRISIPYLFVTFLIMPVVSYISIWISVRYFGKPQNQLEIIPGLISWVPILLLAPTFEELAWRGYGMDSLRAKLGMLPASLAFGVLWAFWHVPLLFINRMYQHDLMLMGPIYVANFFISVIPAAVIANWLYYKHNRSIPAAIILHFMLDIVAISFNIDQFSKCIITAMFVVVAILIVVIDRPFFREGPRNFIEEPSTT